MYPLKRAAKLSAKQIIAACIIGIILVILYLTSNRSSIPPQPLLQAQVRHSISSTTRNYDDIVFENVNISELQARVNPYSEMSDVQQRFTYGLVKHFKPKKVVEIGVSKGGSAALIMSAIKDDPSAHLYSIDKMFMGYRTPGKEVGFLINESFPELLPKWTLYREVITAQVVERIGSGIDCVLLDTMHVTPGEFLDFLQILPYLSENALVIIHDINWHVPYLEGKKNPTGLKNILFSNNILFYYLRGVKILPQITNTYFWNIGAVVLSPNQRQYDFDYFYPLGWHWQYMPSEEDLGIIRQFFIKHYGERLTQLYDESVMQNRLYVAQK